MKKLIFLQALLLTFLFVAPPVFAQSADVAKIETFIRSVIQIMVTFGGLIAVGFFVWGGYGYITSSGNPEALDKSKKTIWYSAIGLAIVIGGYVISDIVAGLANTAFGTK
jgi:hypothetical protein